MNIFEKVFAGVTMVILTGLLVVTACAKTPAPVKPVPVLVLAHPPCGTADAINDKDCVRWKVRKDVYPSSEEPGTDHSNEYEVYPENGGIPAYPMTGGIAPADDPHCSVNSDGTVTTCVNADGQLEHFPNAWINEPCKSPTGICHGDSNTH